jgi:hypothetical protein
VPTRALEMTKAWRRRGACLWKAAAVACAAWSADILPCRQSSTRRSIGDAGALLALPGAFEAPRSPSQATTIEVSSNKPSESRDLRPFQLDTARGDGSA